MKKLLSRVGHALKTFFLILWTFLKKVFAWIIKIIKKFFYLLTHNKVIMMDYRYLTLFGKLKIRITNKRRDAVYGFIFIGLWVIGFLALTLYPLIMSLIYSLNKVTITAGEGIQFSFIGFGNFISIFTADLDFITYVQAFIGQIVLYVPIILVISMMIAILLNQKIKFRGFFRSIYFLPVIIASGPVINELLKQGAGTIPMIEQTGLLTTLNAVLPSFLAKPIGSLFSQMIIVLWFSGVQIVLFLAGLQKIGKEIYEAAQIDGASPWESFWKITLPSLKNIILVSSIYTIVMLATFANNDIIQHIQKQMFDTSRGYGYSSALAWIYFLLVALILGIVAAMITGRKESKIKHRVGGGNI